LSQKANLHHSRRRSSCLSHPSAGITGLCHHTQLTQPLGEEEKVLDDRDLGVESQPVYRIVALPRLADSPLVPFCWDSHCHQPGSRHLGKGWAWSGLGRAVMESLSPEVPPGHPYQVTVSTKPMGTGQAWGQGCVLRILAQLNLGGSGLC
jgi:hypothetical protein